MEAAEIIRIAERWEAKAAALREAVAELSGGTASQAVNTGKMPVPQSTSEPARVEKSVPMNSTGESVFLPAAKKAGARVGRARNGKPCESCGEKMYALRKKPLCPACEAKAKGPEKHCSKCQAKIYKNSPDGLCTACR